MARKKRRKVASRGSVNNIILRTLVNGDKYGYEIIKEVEEFSEGKIQLKQPSLYSSLSRFEDKKYVTSYWGDSDIGGRRHYYHLTELGMQYYRKAVLKEDIEIDEDDIEDEIDDENVIDSNINNDEFEDEDEVGEVNNSPIDNEQQIVYQEISEDEIPAIANFENKKEEKVIIADHQFHRETPIENIIKNEDTPTTKTNQEVIQSENTQDEKPWLELSNSVKKSNAKVSESKFNTMYFKKPKKEYKVILDKDGIYKLRDDDYVPVKNSKPVIIDNVGKRTNTVNFYDYSTYSENKPRVSNQKAYSELSDEEKRKRNENFIAKFNLITNSKMKPISTPAPKVEEKKPEKPIDYRGKLNAIIESAYVEEEEEEVVEEVQENNLFNYENMEDWNLNDSSEDIIEEFEDEEDDQFIDLEPTQEFETKSDNKQYINEINSFTSSNSPVKLNKYETKPRAILVDKTFVLINKLRFVFGIILSLIMIAELTISYFAFKNSDLMFKSDGTLFIIAYCLVAVFAGVCIIPYFVNNNQHKANNFKFKYAIWFGLLTFLVLSILIYCINALSGFELDNFKYFAVKLIVPIILSFNFVIAPIIYEVLNKNKAFYD